MKTAIGRIQKACMFIGAALFGSVSVGSVLVPALMGNPEDSPFAGNLSLLALCLVVLLCYLIYVMVCGAWLGAAVSVVWRSPPGRHIFWTLSGGTTVGTFALVGGVYCTLLKEGPRSRTAAMLDVTIFGVVILVGTVLGLLLGHLIGRRLERAAMVKQTSSAEAEV